MTVDAHPQPLASRPNGWPRVAAAFAIGFAVVPLVGPFVPGPLGAFSLMGGLGFAAVVVCPGWAGFLACAAGLTTLATINALMTDSAGVHFLALLFVLVAMAAGACAGTIYNAIRSGGVHGALRDRRILAAAAAAVILGVGLLASYGALTGTGSPP